MTIELDRDPKPIIRAERFTLTNTFWALLNSRIRDTLKIRFGVSNEDGTVTLAGRSGTVIEVDTLEARPGEKVVVYRI